MATPRKNFSEPFNAKVPPLFAKGGELDEVRSLGARIRLMADMPENHFSTRDWQAAAKSARVALADLCFLYRRGPTLSELSQLDWVEEAGHRIWMADATRPGSEWELKITALTDYNTLLLRAIETLRSYREEAPGLISAHLAVFDKEVERLKGYAKEIGIPDQSTPSIFASVKR